jgi:hypothetical protein
MDNHTTHAPAKMKIVATPTITIPFDSNPEFLEKFRAFCKKTGVFYGTLTKELNVLDSVEIRLRYKKGSEPEVTCAISDDKWGVG